MFGSGATVARWLGAITLGMAALLVLLVIGATEDDDAGPATSGVARSALPALANSMLPVINDVLDHQCPELPAVWVLAEVMAESGWRPHAWSSDSNGGAAGLYQINQRNWVAAGGRPWGGSPPPPGADIYQPETQLRIAIPWVCTNLRAVTGHLGATGKPTSPLDAMLVCHIAGCGRVTGSARGVPKPGEAGCGGGCVSLVNRYLDTVHRYVWRFSAPQAAPDARAAAVTIGPGGPAGGAVTIGTITTSALPSAPTPFTGPTGGGCTQPDPTGTGCLTPAARWGLDQEVSAFGDFHLGPTLRGASCWDAHAWNSGSDHAEGRACDLFPGRGGTFARGAALQQGWRVANWFRSYAVALHVAYLIWQGRFWQPGTQDRHGWGERYDGGGVYDVKDPTGGHYDHVHVSFAR